jgi:hypothetical protein
MKQQKRSVPVPFRDEYTNVDSQMPHTHCRKASGSYTALVLTINLRWKFRGQPHHSAYRWCQYSPEHRITSVPPLQEWEAAGKI